MITDGLWDAYGNVHMGDCGELCAKEKGISRADQDAFAAEIGLPAGAARAGGRQVPWRDQAGQRSPEEGARSSSATMKSPAAATSRSSPRLRPAFQKDGTITAGNASSINDGAAALVLAGADVAAARGWKPQARIVGAAVHAQAPEWFTTAPAGAIERLLDRVGWKKDDVESLEINGKRSRWSRWRTTACWSLDPARVNVQGGAVALGHPIGTVGRARAGDAFGGALADAGKRRGDHAVAVLGGGEGDRAGGR